MTWEEYHKIGQDALVRGKEVSRVEIFGGESITYDTGEYLVYGDSGHYNSIKHKESGVVHTENSFIRGVPGSSSDGRHFTVDLTCMSDDGIDTMLLLLNEEKKLRKAEKLQELNKSLEALVREASFLSGNINIQTGGPGTPCGGTVISLREGVRFVEAEPKERK